MIQLYLVRDFGLQSPIKLSRLPVFPQSYTTVINMSNLEKKVNLFLMIHAGNLDDIHKQESTITKGCLFCH